VVLESDENQAGRSKGRSRDFQKSQGSRNSSRHGRISSRVGAGVLAGLGFPAPITRQSGEVL